jgi:hypothetical protein
VPPSLVLGQRRPRHATTRWRIKPISADQPFGVDAGQARRRTCPGHRRRRRRGRWAGMALLARAARQNAPFPGIAGPDASTRRRAGVAAAQLARPTRNTLRRFLRGALHRRHRFTVGRCRHRIATFERRSPVRCAAARRSFGAVHGRSHYGRLSGCTPAASAIGTSSTNDDDQQPLREMAPHHHRGPLSRTEA